MDVVESDRCWVSIWAHVGGEIPSCRGHLGLHFLVNISLLPTLHLVWKVVGWGGIGVVLEFFELPVWHIFFVACLCGILCLCGMLACVAIAEWNFTLSYGSGGAVRLLLCAWWSGAGGAVWELTLFCSMESKRSVFHDGDDYSVWKLQAAGVLAGKGFYGMDLEFDEWVKRNIGRLETAEKKLSRAVWDTYQEDALVHCWRLLSAPIIKKVNHVKSAMGLFKALDDIYQQQGGIEVMMAMQQLVSLRMDDGDVEKYITKFDGLINELSARGHEVVKLEKALFLLFGIPEEWAHLRAQIFVQYGKNNIKVEDVKAAIRQYGLSIKFDKVKLKKEGEDNSRDAEKALMARGGGGGIKCKKCGRRGHKEEKCDTVCYCCRKVGHISTNCPEKDEKAEKPMRSFTC